MRITLTNDYKIDRMTIEEIRGDSILIGSQTFSETGELARAINVTDIAEIRKKGISTGKTFLLILVVVPVVAALFSPPAKNPPTHLWIHI